MLTASYKRERKAHDYVRDYLPEDVGGLCKETLALASEAKGSADFAAPFAHGIISIHLTWC